MDQTRFLLACNEVIGVQQQRRGIGTLGEKTLHAVLKRYFEPSEQNQEVSVGPYVADIWGEDGIIEIQTRSFDRLRAKLDFFLAAGPVTVVYPVPALKWLVWLDEDGTATPRRKSPKRAGPCELLPELYQIKPLLQRPGLRFCVALLELEECRLKNGWSADGKKGSTRFDRYPVALLDEVWIEHVRDYIALIPSALPEVFTSKDFGRAARLSPKKTSAALNVLFTVGAVVRCGKIRNAYQYRRGKEGEAVWNLI